jgi:flagellin
MARTERALNTSLGRLASGLRIVRASDDAAGLAVSETLRAQTRSLAVARRNAADGISLAQTAEAALNEQHGILMRMRELAVQAANGTVSSDQRSMLNGEFEALTAEFGRIAATTEFNGVQLLNQSGAEIDLQVGITNAATDRITISLFTTTSGAVEGGTDVDIGALSIDTSANALAALATTALDQAIENVSTTRGSFGVAQNRLQITIDRLHNAQENLMAAESRIRDADIALETSSMTRNQILMQAGASMLAQANQLPALAMSLIG